MGAFRASGVRGRGRGCKLVQWFRGVSFSGLGLKGRGLCHIVCISEGGEGLKFKEVEMDPGFYCLFAKL